jgi:hypothetical protein
VFDILIEDEAFTMVGMFIMNEPDVVRHYVNGVIDRPTLSKADWVEIGAVGRV